MVLMTIEYSVSILPTNLDKFVGLQIIFVREINAGQKAERPYMYNINRCNKEHS